jgi:Phosphate-selective porin O and P
MKTRHASRFGPLALALLCIAGPVPVLVAQQESADDAPLTRREFEKFLEDYRQFRGEYVEVKKENEKLRKELAELKADTSGAAAVDWEARLNTIASQQRASILDDVREELRDVTGPLLPGLTNFAIGGAAVVTYQDRDNVDSTFGATFAPILLWQPSDKLLFETQIEFGLSGEETNVELAQFQMSYLLNDYVTLGAGKFLTPFGTFWERWHPTWINKTPTMPLVYERGLIGETGLGVQVRGGFPIGKTKVNYAAYYVNGPDFDDTSPGSAGRLGFENYRDNNNDKSFGGRVGFLPIPEMELGYSFLTGRVGSSGSGSSGIDTFVHGVDFAYAREFEAIRGRLDLRAEAVWVDTDRLVFTGPFDPFTFDNKRNGWFVQAAYRPTLSSFKLGDTIEMKNVEFVVRYDQLRESGPGRLGADHDKLTLGLDYWFRPNIVWKAAYTHDRVRGDDDENGFFMQLAVGF